MFLVLLQINVIIQDSDFSIDPYPDIPFFPELFQQLFMCPLFPDSYRP